MTKKKKKTASKKKKNVSKGKKKTPFSFPKFDFSLPEISLETWGLFLWGVALLSILSLSTFTDGDASSNALGLVGHLMGWAIHYLVGLGGFFVTAFVAYCGWRLVWHGEFEEWKGKTFFFLLSLFSFCVLGNLFAEHFSQTVENLFGRSIYSEYVLLDSKWVTGQSIRYYIGGVPAYALYLGPQKWNLHHLLSNTGIAIVFTTLYTISTLRLTGISVVNLYYKLAWRRERSDGDGEGGFLRFIKLRIPSFSSSSKGAVDDEYLEIAPEKELTERPSISKKIDIAGALVERVPLEQADVEPPPPPYTPKPKQTPKEQKKKNPREEALRAQSVHNGDFTEYKIPPPSILTSPKKVDQTHLKKGLRRQAEVLEETLTSFGIDAKVGEVNCGPTITSFEVHPAIGVKVQKIRSLESDIALNMEATSVRIIAPIPGKAAVGIEVPNTHPQEVAFRELLTTFQNSGTRHEIPLLLGKTVNGDHVISDLAKMPHLIIAGATGSGKSVCINTIVMSLLMNAKPDEIKLLMVDPKKVELTPYTKLPHMIAPVITEPKGACAALNWLVQEMEKRYEILKLVGVRNIKSFNTRTRDVEKELTAPIEIPQRLPYMVGIIDELADLMMVASSDIETPIARIAQMARAVGIHLILATQRPSREVITGIIKANFPTRISFKVSSRVNSGIILDENGAETLLGNGDMLFLPPGTHTLLRAQGAFIRDEDINTVVDFICEQAPPNYQIDSFDEMDPLLGEEEEEIVNGESPRDILFEQARVKVKEAGQASITFLQRKLKIEYARAASLIDQLEREGVIERGEPGMPHRVCDTSRLEFDQFENKRIEEFNSEE